MTEKFKGASDAREEHRTHGVAEIEDEDVIARSPTLSADAATTPRMDGAPLGAFEGARDVLALAALRPPSSSFLLRPKSSPNLLLNGRRFEMIGLVLCLLAGWKLMRKVASGKTGLFPAAAAQFLATSFLGLVLLLIALAAQWLAGLAGFAFFISGTAATMALWGLGVMGLTVSFGTAALFAAVMLSTRSPLRDPS